MNPAIRWATMSLCVAGLGTAIVSGQDKPAESVTLANASPATAPTTSPAAPVSALDANMAETRANQAFAASDYATALALYERLMPSIKDPDRLALYAERVRVAKRQLGPVANAAATALPGGPNTVYTDANGKPIEMAAGKRTKHPAPKPGETFTTTLHELGNFDYDQDEGGNIPDDVKALNGTKVRISGFMLPIDQADKISRFMLVNDIMSCCFGNTPNLQHVLLVTAPGGKAVSYFPDQIVVEGTLKVEEKKEDGFIVSLFELEPTSVRPAAK